MTQPDAHNATFALRQATQTDTRADTSVRTPLTATCEPLSSVAIREYEYEYGAMDTKYGGIRWDTVGICCSSGREPQHPVVSTV
jgi:hypothetical protein